MKNITKQYQDLLEGRMSKANFMINVRREFPQWISSTNTFQDAVNILKSKRILNESHEGHEQWAESMYSQVEETLHQMEQSGQISEYQRERAEYALEHYDFQEGDTPEKVAKELVFVSQHPDDDDAAALASIEKMEKEKGAEDIYHGSIHELVDETVSPELTSLITKLTDEQQQTLLQIIKKMTEKGVSKLDVGKKLQTAFGINPDKDPHGVGYDTLMGVFEKLNEDINHGYDRVDYRQLVKGTEFELMKMDEISDENYLKAKEKAYKKLQKDPKAYMDLIIANQTEVEKTDKTLRTQPVKGDNLVDKANAMKTLKKDAKANTQTNLGNKERAKGMPKGVKTMKESVVDRLTDIILAEYFEVGTPKKKFAKGQKVTTPEGETGVVEEVSHDSTATLKMEDGSLKDFQENVLKPAEEAMQEYEYGDETPDQPMSDDATADEIAQKLIDYYELEPGQTYTKSQLDTMFNDYESEMGQRLDNETFQLAIEKLKAKGNEMTFGTKPAASGGFRPGVDLGKSFDKFKSLKEKLTKAIKKDVEEGAVAVPAGTPSQIGEPLVIGRNTGEVTAKARSLKSKTGDSLEVVDTKTGRRTKV